MFFVLRVLGRRNLFLIKFLVYCMKKKMLDDFLFKFIVLVFISISKFNFYDVVLLGFLSDYVVMKINGV